MRVISLENVSDQFIHGPGVEGLLGGLISEDVVGTQGVESIGQVFEGGRVERGGLAGQALDDQDVEPLALQGEFQLELDPPGAPGEEVGQGHAEQAVPGGGGVAGHHDPS